MRRVLFLLLVVLAALAGVAAASAFVSQGTGPQGSDPPSGSRSLDPDGGHVVVHAIADDPEGGPRWGVRVYRSEAGLTCPNAGRVSEGRFGRVDARGEHVRLPQAADGACADLTSSPLALAIQRHPARPGQGERGVVFGVVSEHVSSLTYATPAGERQLPVTRDGAFLAVEPDAGMAGATLTVRTEDGGAETFRLDE